MIPAPLSIYDVVFEVPTKAPAEVATESASKALSIPSTSPSLFTLSVRLATLVSVPAVSKKSMNNKVKKIISIKNLTKIYKNGFCALNKINLDINKGEIFALLGPIGCKADP